MSVTYRPTHQFVGQNSISIEYELRKLSQKFETISGIDSDIRSVASGAMSIASEALLKSAADPAVATNTAAIAVNTAAIAALTNEVEGIRLGLWS
jgi:hypothetical protein|tara:strand:+ start:83 stop:367 length:285 start_codon:yes stop_codon:yes gene_type:complete